MSVMSMTGFGRCHVERDGRKIMAELKTVNHRFLDIGMRLPRVFSPYEDLIRKTLQGALARGHVDVYLKYENISEGSQQILLNRPLLEAYLAVYGEVHEQYGIPNNILMSDVSSLPDVFLVESASEDEELLKGMIIESLEGALSQLNAMRGDEGARLTRDFEEKLDNMRQSLQVIESRSALVVEEYRTKLRTRIGELLESLPLDENKLAGEVVWYADRCCIDEEIVRLKSHMKQFDATLRKQQSVGRQLDFLVQEMNREVNTICSKSSDLSITSAGLTLKNEIEKLREQIQNVE